MLKRGNELACPTSKEAGGLSEGDFTVCPMLFSSSSCRIHQGLELEIVHNQRIWFVYNTPEYDSKLWFIPPNIPSTKLKSPSGDFLILHFEKTLGAALEPP